MWEVYEISRAKYVWYKSKLFEINKENSLINYFKYLVILRIN